MLWVAGCAAGPRDNPASGPQRAVTLKPMHQGEKIEDDLYDTTAIWQERFGLDGKLKITDGRRDLRGPIADAPIELSLCATPARPGCYTFVFVFVDGFDKPQQVVAVHLYAHESAKNSKPPLITPAQPHRRFIHGVVPNEPAIVRWHDYEGVGRAIAGRWTLADVVYTDSIDYRDRPGIPGYNYRGGE